MLAQIGGDDMAEEARELARAIALLRDARGPSEAEAAHLYANLEHALRGPPGGGDAGPDGQGGGLEAVARAGAHWVYAAKTVAATLVLAAGGLTVLGLGARAVRSATGSDPEPMVASSEPTPRAKDGHEEAKVEAPELQAPEHARPPPRQPRLRRDRRTAAPTPSTPSTNSIEDELALLAAARDVDDPERARAALREHARAHPAGALANERDVLWILLDCEGVVDAARERAEALARRAPNSPLLDRIRSRCPALLGGIDDGH